MSILPRRQTATPDPTPERAALGEAVRENEAHLADIATLERAVAAAKSARSDARAKVDETTAAIDAARTAAGVYAIAVASGAAGDPPQSVKAARAALVDAQDELDAATSAVDHIASQLEGEKKRRWWFEGRLQQATVNVLQASPQVAALIDEVAQLQRALYDKGRALQWLVGKDAVVTKIIKDPPYFVFTPVGEVANRLDYPLCSWLAMEGEVPGSARWQAAWEALKKNASAPLPS